MKLFGTALVACTLASCAQMKSFKTAAVEKAGSLSSSMANLMPNRNRIPVVKPRPGEMKDYKTGAEQALAFEKTKRNSNWSLSRIFGGPVDFKEPVLPADSGVMDGELLPPKIH